MYLHLISNRYRSPWQHSNSNILLTHPGRTFNFYPERPALTAVCRQLSNEALSIYYAESTFFFADTMLWPDIMKAYRLLRGNLLDHVQTIKVHHRPQLRLRLDPPRWDNETYCSVKFTAHLENRTNVVLTDVQTTVIDRNHNVMRSPNGKEQLCLCFLETVLNRTKKIYSAPALIQFLTNYVHDLQGVCLDGGETCRACGRKKTIKYRGACCGYIG